MEEWKDVNGYEGMYQVSSFGRVRSVDRVVKHNDSYRRIKGRDIVLRNHGCGYKMVNLWKNNNVRIAYVHRLVAEAFIPRVLGKNEVNHIDNNKSNNNVENLEWCTQSENVTHAYMNGFNGSSRSVCMIEGGERTTFYSMTEAERMTGIPHQKISKCCASGKKLKDGKMFVYA